MDCETTFIGEFSKLTDKHRQVLELVSQHLTTKEIARELGVSPHTIEQRIQAVRARFGEVPRRELARIYAELTPVLSGDPWIEDRPEELCDDGFFGKQASPIRQAARNRTESGLASLAWLMAGLSLGLATALVAILATWVIMAR